MDQFGLVGVLLTVWYLEVVVQSDFHHFGAPSPETHGDHHHISAYNNDTSPLIPLNCIRLYFNQVRKFKSRPYRDILSSIFPTPNVFIKKSHGNYAPGDHHQRDTRKVKPWLCAPSIHWRDLGPDYYPRFVKTANCPQRSCFYGFYSCQARAYQITVLHRRNPDIALSLRFNQSDMFCFSDKMADFSSVTLTQNSWEFATVHVSVDCECM